MSVVAISYNNLDSAKNEANKIARRLNTYYNSLNNTVYRKLNNYSGDSSSNISTARGRVSQKLANISNAKEAFNSYASNLSQLKSECKITDKSVKSSVMSMTTQFKQQHGISNNWFENTISFLLTKADNSTIFGRWLSSAKDKWQNFKKGIKDSIKEWLNFDGGKETVKGIIVAACEIVIGVMTIIGALVTGGAFLAVLASVISGFITLTNGFVNLSNEIAAGMIAGNDPSRAKRLQGENTMQDVMRNESNENVGFWYKVARGIDVLSFACSVVSVVSSVKSLIDSGLKWANNLAQVGIKDYFKAGNYKNLFSKIGNSAKNFGKELVSVAKKHDATFLKELLKGFKLNFAENLKNSFTKFDMKSMPKTLKNIAETIKIIPGADNIGDIIIDFGKSFVLPSIVIDAPGMLKFEEQKHIYFFSPGGQGQVQFDYDFNWTAEDFFGAGESIYKKIIGNNLDKSTFTIELPDDILNKISEMSSFDISVPDINLVDIPPIDINISGCISNGLNTTQPNSLISEIPSIDISIDIPDSVIGSIDLNIPNISMPDIAIPDITVPDINIPDITVPDINIPDISIPGMGVMPPKIPYMPILGPDAIPWKNFVFIKTQPNIFAVLFDSAVSAK